MQKNINDDLLSKLKNEILVEIDRLNLVKIVANKQKFRLSRFGQTINLDSNTSHSELEPSIDSNKSKQLICLGQEHCVFYWIAIREV